MNRGSKKRAKNTSPRKTEGEGGGTDKLTASQKGLTWFSLEMELEKTRGKWVKWDSNAQFMTEERSRSRRCDEKLRNRST